MNGAEQYGEMSLGVVVAPAGDEWNASEWTFGCGWTLEDNYISSDETDCGIRPVSSVDRAGLGARAEEDDRIELTDDGREGGRGVGEAGMTDRTKACTLYSDHDPTIHTVRQRELDNTKTTHE